MSYLGGNISIDSKIGEGTSIKVTISKRLVISWVYKEDKDI